MGIPIIGGFLNWIFNGIVMFGLFAVIFFGLKYLLSATLSATVDNIDNFILKIIARFTLPSVIGVGIALLAVWAKCKALSEFALVMAIAVGGPVTWGILFALQNFIHIPGSITVLLMIMMVFSIVELVIPIFLPGLGLLISIILTLAELIIMYIYIGGETKGMINCLMALIGHKAIPGTGGVSIGK